MKAVVWQGIGDVRMDDVPDPKILEPSDAIIRITSIARETETGATGTASTVQRLAQVAYDLQKSVAKFKVA